MQTIIDYTSPKTGKVHHFDWNLPGDPPPEKFEELKKYVEELEKDEPTSSTNQLNIPTTQLNALTPSEPINPPTQPKPESKGIFNPRPMGGYGFLADVGNKVLDIGKSFINSSPAMEFARSTHAPPLNEEDLQAGRQTFMENSNPLSSVGRAANATLNPFGGFDPTGPPVPTAGESLDATVPVRPFFNDVREGNYVGAGLDVGFGALNLMGMRRGLMGSEPLQEPILEKRSKVRVENPAYSKMTFEELRDKAADHIGDKALVMSPGQLWKNLSSSFSWTDPEVGPLRNRLAVIMREEHPNESLTDILKKYPNNEIPKEPVKGLRSDIPVELAPRKGEIIRKDPLTQERNRPGLDEVVPPIPPTNKPPTNTGGIPPPNNPKDPLILKRQLKDSPNPSALREAWNLSRGLMGVDLPFITSAAFRQGFKLIGTGNWFKAWIPSIKAYGSKNFFETHKAMIMNDPLSKPSVQPVFRNGNQLIKDGRPVFKEGPSIIEKAGVRIADISSLSGREEAIRSQLAERIPVWGKVVGASNRAYTAFINDLRLNAFRNLYEAMPNKHDLKALKELGDTVNTLTGAGPLKLRMGGSISGERLAQPLSDILFSPKLMASNAHMFNPANYIHSNPQVRKEFLKAALRTTGAWFTLAQLGKLTGGEVNDDMTSSDFGKIRIGDFRLDPAGGLQQFLVLMNRIGSQESTSSTSGKSYQYGQGYKPQTTGSALEDFIVNKLHPTLRSFYDTAYSTPDKPFGVVDRSIDMAIPMITKDLIDIAREEPALVPFLAPLISAGMGGQYYEKGDYGKPRLVPSDFDLSIQGFPTNIKLPGGGGF